MSLDPDRRVYVTGQGTRYHLDRDCSALDHSGPLTPTTAGEAKQDRPRRSRCSVCGYSAPTL
ncbi:ORF 35 [Haloarcula hispanica virus SH1]|uniref:ORF 35 n=1 Tax=Haloarcula hispanica SH1 virus TaxID=326574 RepID=Q4KPF2_9VIRU|nr:ORF 35 [Haloarcula hispanica virus SH1]AAY24961.1 ORF 35 [Haloarcula hispanica virus SH1]